MVWNAALAGFFRANWKVGTVSWAWERDTQKIRDEKVATSDL